MLLDQSGMTRTLIALISAGLVAACSGHPQAPPVADLIHHSLDANGLKDVDVSQDRDKGLVTLTGHVPSEADKAQANGLAQRIARDEVVVDEIVVTPPPPVDADKLNDARDSAIAHNLKAAFLEERLGDDINYKVKTGVVTLHGEVATEMTRRRIDDIAMAIPNVRQVIDDLHIRR